MDEGDVQARDGAWVEAVLAGDVQAFSELYREYAPVVRRIALDHVHDAQTADDVVSETFVRALERLATLESPGRFRQWLTTIARNHARDVLRRRQVEGPAAADDGVPEPRAAALGPEELAELAELAELVDGAVVGLTRKDAVAVTMMTGLGFSSTDVAAALALTPGAAKVAAHRARRRLRQSLVLRVLVRARATDCPELHRLIAEGDHVRAARHADACATCRTAAAVEISLYELEPDDPDATVPEGLDQGPGHGGGPPRDEAEP
ncbi:MAG TPA: sigma-70 family RNA polymerase sigma factor [Acidimicrobiales bacterium]|jgi:RNA polymerase sigma-70 factor (ECF subfamily)